MMADGAAGGTYDNSRVFSRMTGAIGANPVLYLGLSLILAGPPAFIGGWWQFDLRATVDPANPYSAFAQYMTADFWLYTCAIWGVAMVCGAILQAALTRATATHLAGRKPGIVACLETGLTLIVPMVALSLIVGIGVGIGFLLLIVPGVILWMYWAVASPARVQERITVFDALRRSAELTSGHRGSIFVLLFGTIIGLAVLGWIVRVLLGMMLHTAASQPMFALVEALIGGASSMVMITLAASLYVELRTVKEGVAPDELAGIFA